MTTITSSSASPPSAIQSPRERPGTFSKTFNWDYFLQDNITGSKALMIWVILLAAVTFSVMVSQLNSAPQRTGIILGVWLIALLATVLGELFTLHTPISRWLKGNMLNSASNTLITLLISLLTVQVVASLLNWGFVNATFDTALTAPDVRGTGASWGVIWAARKLLLTGQLSPDHTWRVLLFAGMFLVLWILAVIAARPVIKSAVPLLGQVVNILWLISPVISYIFLAGVTYQPPFYDLNTLGLGLVAVLVLMGLLWSFKVIQLNPVSIFLWVAAWPIAYFAWRFVGETGLFPPIDVDQWGGLLLTMIFAIFVNVLSFPIGVLLALGRRSGMQGIPPWIVWPIALLSTIYLLTTTTPELWETSRNSIERLLALWPVLIVISAYFFMRSFDGNVVKAFSILSIEVIRGVPLITLLFMAIVMAPFFTGEGVELDKFWAVIIGYSIFSSAYMAELVRGGLQAISKGQYEASDSLGLNTLQKYRFIILPQALRILIPPLAGAVIGTFKSSSLVALVNLLDLVGVTRTIIANQEWLGLRTELYAFMFILYFLISSVVSSYSRRLEERTGLGVR